MSIIPFPTPRRLPLTTTHRQPIKSLDEVLSTKSPLGGRPLELLREICSSGTPILGIDAPPTPAESQQKFLTLPDGYQPGAIIYCSWGYEQTNINFYRIEKRSGDFVILTPLRQQDRTETHFMSGTTMPSPTPKDYATDHDPAWSNKDMANPKPSFRRKLHIREGVINGLNVFGSGWARLWDGTPMGYSSYA